MRTCRLRPAGGNVAVGLQRQLCLFRGRRRHRLENLPAGLRRQGYAAGTAATLGIVLEDLRALHVTLTGSEPAQTSRGTLGRSFASLAPRQRATLAASLLEFISRVQTAQAAAAAPTAGEDEARAAQEAADDALRALQLVITADTADRAGGDEQVQTAAIAALQAITRVDVTDPDARVQVNRALGNALEAAEDRVADLEEELAAALAAARRRRWIFLPRNSVPGLG